MADNRVSVDVDALLGNNSGAYQGSSGSLIKKIKNKLLKRIDVDDISHNNPDGDVFKRGFRPENVSYQRTYFGENGRFDCSVEPIVVYDVGNGQFMMQGGHHRLKAAKDLGLKTIKVNQIIPYHESVRLGITNLPLGQMPKSY